MSTIEQPGALERFVSRGMEAQQAVNEMLAERFKDLGVKPNAVNMARGLALEEEAKKIDRQVLELQAQINQLRGQAKKLRGEAYKAFTDTNPTLFDAHATAATPGDNGPAADATPKTPVQSAIDELTIGKPGDPIDLAQARACMNWKNGDRAFSQLLGVEVDVVAIGDEMILVEVDGLPPRQKLQVPATDLKRLELTPEDAADEEPGNTPYTGGVPPIDISKEVAKHEDDVERVLISGETYDVQDLDLSDDLIERAFAGTEIVPNDPHLSDDELKLHSAMIGKALHLDIFRHFAVVTIAMRNDHKLVTLQPIERLKPDVKGYQQWGERRMQKAHRHRPPEAIPLAGVIAYDRDKRDWVFGLDEHRIFVKIPRSTSGDVPRSPTADVAPGRAPTSAKPGGHSPEDVAEANMAGGYAVGTKALDVAMLEGPAEAPSDNWKRGGPRNEWLPQPTSQNLQSWYQWALNVYRSVISLAKKKGIELPADFYHPNPNLYWARMYHDGLKSKEAAAAFITGIQHDQEHNADPRADDRLTPEQRDLMKDPNVNEHGVYVKDTLTYRVGGIPKSAKAKVEIRVARSTVDGLYRAAHDVSVGSSGASHAPSVSCPGLESINYAVRNQAQGCLKILQGWTAKNSASIVNKSHVKAAIAAVEKFLKSSPHAQIGGK